MTSASGKSSEHAVLAEQSPAALFAATADRLNHSCFCISLDQEALMQTLDHEVEQRGFAEALATSHPTLFSNVPVFVSQDTVATMERVVAAVETAALLPGFQQAAMSWAPAIALADHGPVGALMGYDFHITETGPRLIEVNTNAGGAFLNHALASAQRTCCLAVEPLIERISPPRNFSDEVKAMFTAEWQFQRGTGRPATIAIVDDDPEAQFLMPEFKLARALLEANGIKAIITDPSAFRFDGTTLKVDGLTIDLVYNRLVDFALANERHAALAAAYASGKVVLSPTPRNHALLADKRNLSLLSAPATLENWGLAANHREALSQAVPNTAVVNIAHSDSLWANRRQLFFKPADGYGSRAAYRGDKITRKVWAQILDGGYVAQSFAPPSHRMVVQDGVLTEFKLDIRLYTYAGKTLLVAARLYQGQTTNMRTPGGGFAPVLEITEKQSKNLAVVARPFFQ